MSGISDKIRFFDEAARAERLSPPPAAQQRHAVRHPGGIRKAYCKDDPGTGNTITCYLDTDGTGEEITVHCSIANGSNLNEAAPRLQGGTGIPPTGGTLIYVAYIDDEWRCLTVFDAAREVHIAYCKTDAPATDTITCYLDTDGTGEEITVHCSIANGLTLNQAIPRLRDGDKIFVQKIQAGGNDYWWCLTMFQASVDCICYP